MKGGIKFFQSNLQKFKTKKPVRNESDRFSFFPKTGLNEIFSQPSLFRTSGFLAMSQINCQANLLPVDISKKCAFRSQDKSFRRIFEHIGYFCLQV